MTDGNSRAARWPERAADDRFGWPPPPGDGSRISWWAWCTYSLVALGICLPLLKKGYPFAFDMAFGPNADFPEEAFGLGADFGRRVPNFVFLAIAGKLIDPGVIGKAILVAIPILAGAGLHRLSPARAELARLSGGLLYAVNPFTYQRLVAGHWHILLGYALLPWAIGPVLRWVGGYRDQGGLARAGLWFVLLGISSFVVATELLLIGAAGALAIGGSQLRARIGRVVALVAVFCISNAIWIAPALVKVGAISEYTQLDWRAFLVRGGSSWGALGNVLRLGGFWREDFAPPVFARPAGLILFVAVVLVVVLGVVAAVRSGSLGPKGAYFVLFTGLLAAVLALGERAPLVGPVLEYMYPRIPGWQIMRETQKLVGLLAFAYALFFSLGAEVILRSSEGFHTVGGGDRSQGTYDSPGEKIWARGAAAALVLIPLAWSPNIFWGAGGRVVTAEYPPGWYKAEEALREIGPGRAVVFPWHVHMPFDFTGGRTNVNPAGDFFSKDLIEASQVEFPGFRLGVEDPSENYVRELITVASSDPGSVGVGSAIAPLGADSVILLKTADWTEYSFLDRQSDLEKVVDDPSVAVYKGPGPAGVLEELLPCCAPPVGALEASGGGWQSRVAYLDSEEPSPGPCPMPDGRVVPTSPIRYRIPGPGCFLIPETEKGWRSPAPLGPVDGGIALAARTDSESEVTFAPAYVAIGGHLLSAFFLLAMVVKLSALRYRGRGRPGRVRFLGCADKDAGKGQRENADVGRDSGRGL